MKRLRIDNFTFHSGWYDFILLKDKIEVLLSSVEMDEVFYKIDHISFLHVELLTSHEMEVIHKQNYTTDVLTLVFPRQNLAADVFIYIDPMLIYFLLKLDIEFENSYLAPSLDNRIIELVNHGIFHAVGLDHPKDDVNPRMLDFERVNLVRYIENV